MSALPQAELFDAEDAAPGAPELRPYQRKMTNELLACFARGVPGTLGVLPTGGGKTVVISNALGTLHAEGWDCWFFVHRRELLRQASRTFRNAGLPHGIVAPGHEPGSHRLHVASIDTVGARMGSLHDRLKRANLGLFDETQHIVANTWASVATLLPQRGGLTATPFRADGRPLGDFYDQAVVGPAMAELIEMGYLSPPSVFAPPTSIDVAGIRKRGGDFIGSQLAQVVDTSEITEAAVRYYARLCPGIPCIVFCTSVAHAHHVAERFSSAGWLAQAVDGDMSARDRDAAILGLAEGRLQILTSCDLISEGTDIPVVGAAMLLRPTESTMLYLQQVGRVLRPYPGKTESVIIDIARNVARHGMPQAKRRWSLHGGIKGEERAVTATRRCASCWSVCETGPERCPRCGRKYPSRGVMPGAPAPARLSLLPAVAGFSAEEIQSMSFKAVVRLGQSRRDLEIIAEIRGYKPHWVDHVLEQRAQVRRPGGYGRW